MKCPKCGGAPQDLVLLTDPPQYRCRECDFVGTEVPWLTGLLRGDEGAVDAHAERLQAAQIDAMAASHDLYEALDMASVPGAWNVRDKIEALIDAKVTLALLERG